MFLAPKGQTGSRTDCGSVFNPMAVGVDPVPIGKSKVLIQL